ncbi:hypothetical protein ACQJBY_024776 [Aegilops geniculata]
MDLQLRWAHSRRSHGPIPPTREAAMGLSLTAGGPPKKTSQGSFFQPNPGGALPRSTGARRLVGSRGRPQPANDPLALPRLGRAGDSDEGRRRRRGKRRPSCGKLRNFARRPVAPGGSCRTARLQRMEN